MNSFAEGTVRPAGRALRSLAGLWLVLALVLGVTVQPATAQESQDATSQNAVELAERYAPIIMVKAQEEPCDVSGEPYAPTSVEIVLDNPEVLLRQLGTGNPVVQRGPGATDLFELSEGFFLDFPGSSLEPGCIYERDFERYSRTIPATVYAHVVQQEGHPDQLALQYWFYWYYNDWNNKHESDWEGIQLLFDASSIAEALTGEPVSVGFAQHEGGERADWESTKLERSGSHPVVYSSAGSHASYFDSVLYLGRSGGEGFGCDSTVGPSDRLEPQTVLLPDRVDDPADELAWLTFEGRWGERQSGPFNGPTGPGAKERWLRPVDWHDELRNSSVVIPGGSGTGATVVNAFCAAVETGSGLLLSFQLSPLRIVFGLALIALFARWLITRTDWSRVPTRPLRLPRTAGQLLRATVTLSRRSLAAIAVFGAFYIPIAAVVGFLGGLLTVLPLIGDLLGLTGRSSGTSLILAVLAGSLPHLVAVVVINALVAVVLDRGAADQAARREAIRQVRDRWRDLAGGLLRAILVVGALLVTVVGVPFAIRQLVRYQFIPHVIMLEGVDGRQALSRSSDLVKGRWWNTAAVVGVINVGISAAALLTGLLLLVLATGLPMWLFSGLISLIYAFVVPPAAVAQTLLYGNAVAESAGSEDNPMVDATS